jgi:hypothetical protein
VQRSNSGDVSNYSVNQGRRRELFAEVQVRQPVGTAAQYERLQGEALVCYGKKKLTTVLLSIILANVIGVPYVA